MRTFNSERGDGWVDVYDEALMIKLGIHQPNWVAPDFSKTPKEKIALKKAKRNANDISHSSCNIKESSFPLYSKIIVTLKKNDNFKNRVHSAKLWQYQIPNYLSQFSTKKGRSIIDHYIWNDCYYSDGQLPINPYKCNGKKK